MPPLLEPPPAPPPRDPTPEELARIRALVEEVTARVRANTNADETVSGGSYGARYLSAGQLDAINPLPNGRKRVAA
jgi:hypothetical protein